MMKTVILHDYLENIGGAERVVLTLARDLDADVYTLNYNPKVNEKTMENQVNIINIQDISNKPVLKQVAASRVFSKIDLKNTHIILTSDHGNIEDLTTKSHTRNLAMTLIWGPNNTMMSQKLKSITDVTPALMEFLKVSFL